MSGPIYTPESEFSSNGILTSWTVEMSVGGITSANRVLTFKRGDGFDYANGIMGNDPDAHPDIEWLIAKNASVAGKGPLDTVTVSYEGINKETEMTKYTLEVATTQEPIDTHPKFADFGGIPTDANAEGVVESTGAKFSGNTQDAAFIKFTMKDGEKGDEDDNKVGTSSYLEPSVTWTEERTLGEGLSGSAQDSLVENLGTIYDDVPRKVVSASEDSELPKISDDIGGNGETRNWLFTHATYEQVGKGGILKRTWRLSGRMGWNELIYADGSSQQDARINSSAFDANISDDFNGEVIGDFPEVEDEDSVTSTWKKTDKNEVTLQVTYQVETGEGIDLASDFMKGNKSHPVYGDMEPISAKIVGSGPTETVDITLITLDDDSEFKPSMDVNTRTEPIDSHFAFQEEKSDLGPLGGTSDAPENGAKFSGVAFSSFASHVEKDDAPSWWTKRLEDSSADLLPNPMSGVSSYLESGLEFKEEKLFSNFDPSFNEIDDIGKRIEPNADAPTPKSQMSGRRDYLCTGISWSMRGATEASGCKVIKKYLLSGQRRWDTDIYDD